MLMRGLKRQRPVEWSDPTVQDDYQRGLSDFQTAARKRESMRLKNQATTRFPLQADSGGSWENTLSDKISTEQKVLEGTLKFMSAANKNEQQSLEAAKTMQSAKLRVDMLKYELDKFRRGRGSPQMKQQQGRPSYGGVCLSDIRIPLVWRSNNEAASEPRRAHCFAVFCIARIGSQIYDTCLVHPVDDRSCADVTFPDVLEFNRVGAHFELTLEVYAHALDLKPPDQPTAMAENPTPQRIARSISRAVGRKLLRSDFGGKGSGPGFEMVASVGLSLDDCSQEVETHEIYVCEPGSQTCPSFFGQVCCRLAAMPYCREEEVLVGPIGLGKGRGSVQKMWARLMDWKLSLWSDLSQKEAARKPAVEIPINRDTCILEKGDNCITVTNVDGGDSEPGKRQQKTVELEFDEAEAKDAFLVHMLQHAADHRRWKKTAQQKMKLYRPLAAKSTSSLGRESVPLYESIVTKRRRNTLKRSATVKKAKSFKRTKSKLAMIYNETGIDEDSENASGAGNQQLI